MGLLRDDARSFCRPICRRRAVEIYAMARSPARGAPASHRPALRSAHRDVRSRRREDTDMPTYSVFAPRGQLDDAQKRRIAADVTHTHTDATGAQGFFAQVVFVETASGDWFMGGAPLTAPHIFVQGQIRGGRPAAMKHALITGLRDALASGAGLPTSRVWCYLIELPPSQMIEYGHVLPEPGGEAAWLASMLDEDRRVMQSIGR